MGKTHRKNLGLSLAELGILLVGVAIVAVVLTTNFHKRAAVQKRVVTIQRLAAIEDALDRYGIDNCGRFPTAKQGGLKALCQQPTGKDAPTNWRGPYLENPEMLLDGWGVPFRYTKPGGGDPPRPFDVWSFGRDGRQNGEGQDRDINSWDRQSQLP